MLYTGIDLHELLNGVRQLPTRVIPWYDYDMKTAISVPDEVTGPQ